MHAFCPSVSTVDLDVQLLQCHVAAAAQCCISFADRSRLRLHQVPLGNTVGWLYSILCV